MCSHYTMGGSCNGYCKIVSVAVNLVFMAIASVFVVFHAQFYFKHRSHITNLC